MTIHVVWLSVDPEVCPGRGIWDQAMTDALLSNELWRTGYDFEHHLSVDEVPAKQGAVVVIPGGYHADHMERLNAALRPLRWVLLVVTSDECSLFAWRGVRHPRVNLWIQTPRPLRHRVSAARFLPVGWPPETPALIRQFPIVARERPLDWFFAGQVTHERREQCVTALRRCGPGGVLAPTEGFLQGMPRAEYVNHLVSAKVAPCPAGPATPDSFRLWEALEAGCLPLADATTPEGWVGYWELTLGRTPPFPIIQDWGFLPELMPELLAEWPSNANAASAWWLAEKRQLVTSLRTMLDGYRPRLGREVADRITVLMPTSVIAHHPNTSIIEETMASLRAQPDMAETEVIVMADGLREGEEHHAERYDEYKRRLLWLAHHSWRNVLVRTFDTHRHQAAMTRECLDLVSTPLVAFVEHDTPVLGEIPWGLIADVVEKGALDLVRLSHEASILEAHESLMIDEGPIEVEGLPVRRTMQWSQRPHVASADWYRQVVGRYFGRAARTMIEEVMHGVVDQAWREQRMAGAKRWRLGIYHPAGDIKRSTHLDGRNGESPGPCIFAYDGPTPWGAPQPTAGRVD